VFATGLSFSKHPTPGEIPIKRDTRIGYVGKLSPEDQIDSSLYYILLASMKVYIE